MKEPTYVDWDGLKYYDKLIKEYIDDKAQKSDEKLNTSVDEVNEKISKVEADVARLDERSAALSAEISENESAIVDLFDKFNDVQQQVSTNTADIENNKKAIAHDHDLIEQLVRDVENKSSEGHKHNASDIVDLVLPDLNNYITRPEVTEQIATSLQGYATEQFVREKILEAEIADEDVDLSDYYTKSEVDALIPSVDGFASEEFVATAIAAIEIPEVPTKVSELENDAGYITSEDIPETDLSNYYNKSETENLIAEAVKDIEHPTVDLDGYATEEWVNTQGFLKEHQDLSDYAKKSDIPQPELFVIDYNAPNFAAALEAYNNGKLLLLTNAAPDANGYAVMNYVRSDLITFTKFLTSRSETYGSFNTYYLHNDDTWEVSSEVKLNKVEANVSEDATFNLTNIKIGKETYSIPETDLSDYYTKAETTTAINEAVAGIKIPEIDLSTYATKAQVEEQVALKADNVPFTTNLVVTTPVGGFVEDESVQGLTIAEILYKLLGLKEVVTPDAPEGSSTVVQDIIDNQRPIYSQNEMGQLVETPFDYVCWTEDDAKQSHLGENDFYQIVDAEGNVLESGYHEATMYNEEAWLTVALPDTVTDITVKRFDGLANDWAVMNWQLVKADEQTIDGYTIWTAPEQYEVMSGDTFRFVIND